MSISVLFKHTGAGHEITLRDLIVLFGSPCATIIGKQLLNDILLWLKANRRSELNFKLANQTQTELALQRLFAFWPQLLISVTPEGEMPQSENIGNLNRENCIISRTLSKAGKLFEIDTKSRGKGEKGISTVQDNLHIEEKNNENYDYNKKKIKKVGQVLSMVPVICSVQLVWPDRHSTNKLFRDPDEFQPNVNFI